MSRDISSASEVSRHSAPGQLAGSFLQAERALFRLATGSRGTVVGIETLDNVAAIDRHGRTTIEQDKHYASERALLANRSKEFWKPAWVSWEDSCERYRQELFAHTDKSFFKERAGAEIQ